MKSESLYARTAEGPVIAGRGQLGEVVRTDIPHIPQLVI